MIETSRTRQLKGLAERLPGANQQIQTGLDEARKTQLQATIGQMAPQQGTTQVIQQLGAQQQQQAGQIAAQGVQRQQNAATQIGQLGLAEAAGQQRAEGFEQQISLSQKDQQLATKLNKVDSRLKNDLLDKQLQFSRDKAGNALFNTRQLADYAAVNARSQEELANYSQMASQVYERKYKIMEAAYRSITTALERGYITKGRELDKKHKLEMAEAARALNEKMNKAKADYANNKAKWSALGTVAGTVIGGVAGSVVPGVGTVAGATLGASIGGTVGGLASDSLKNI